MKQFVVLLSLMLFGVSAYSKTIQTRTPECTVTNIAAAQFGSGLMVTWNVVDPAACPDAVGYSIQYTIDDIVKDADAIMPNGGVIENVELSCTRIDIVVFTLDSGHDSLGESDIKTYNPTLPPVEISSIVQTEDGISVSWEQPDYAETCSLTYTIGWEIDGDEPVDIPDIQESNHIIALPDSTPCVPVRIWLTAVSGEFTSSTVTKDFETGIGKVEALTIVNEDGALVADFKQPGDLGNCGEVSFRVIQKEEACFRSKFAVKPVSSLGTVGEEVEQIIDRGPGPVLNLQAIADGENIQVQWDIPVNSENCDLAFLLEYRDQPVTTHAAMVTVVSKTKACEIDEITVTAISGVNGVPSVVTYRERLGMVNNFRCEPNAPNMICSWNVPSDSDSCGELKYEIHYFDGLAIRTSTVEDLTFSFAPRDCEFSWISIEPISGEIKGRPFETSFSSSDCTGFGRRFPSNMFP